MLQNCLVLIAEDEPFIALDLAMAVEAAHGEVIGPVGSVADAISLLKGARLHGALLDVQLSDGDVSPVAELLDDSGVPFLFHSGLGLIPALKMRYPAAQVYNKPTPPSQLIDALAALIRFGQNNRG